MKGMKGTGWVLVITVTAMLASQAIAQRGPGYGRGRGAGRGRGGPPHSDPRFVADRDVFHFLLQHHDQIQRKVKNIDHGIETTTESKDPEVAANIQEHVHAMYDRVKDGRGIHMRDPLFRELFRHADKIEMKHENTDRGVRVTETSDDPYVARLIQGHAKVVSLFVKNGFSEAHVNHALPAAETNPVTATSAAKKDSPPAKVCPHCPAAAGKCPAGEECCPEKKTGN
jgi:hypothetical protein